MILFNRSRILKLCVINVLTNRLIFSDVIVCIIFSGGWGVGGGGWGKGSTPIYWPYEVCTAGKGMVFKPFSLVYGSVIMLAKD